MIKIMYVIKPEDAPAEKEWLYNMKIYPACRNYVDWVTGKSIVQFCMIVGPDAALSIKLRHPLQMQETYKQR